MILYRDDPLIFVKAIFIESMGWKLDCRGQEKSLSTEKQDSGVGCSWEVNNTREIWQ